MRTLRTADVNANIEHIKDILDQDGCIVIKNILDSSTIRRLQNELDSHFNETPHCQGDFYGYATKRIGSLIAKSFVCQELAINQIILEAMDKILLQSCNHYQLNLTQGIRIGPNEPQQIIHRDDLMFPYLHIGKESMVNVMWAVDDFTKENGATYVIPGSHKWNPDRQPSGSEIIQAEMKSGSALIYYGSLLHGGGENRSLTPRTGIVISYCLGWLRQAENQYLAVPFNIAKKLPERLQILLGYFVHQPNLGSVEGQDPILLLKNENVVNAQFQEFLSEKDKTTLSEYKNGLRKAV